MKRKTKKLSKIAKALGASKVTSLGPKKLKGPLDWLSIARRYLEMRKKDNAKTAR